MPFSFKILANSSAMDTIDDWDPRNRASFRMLTKIGRGASWLISVMIPANLTMKSAFGTNMRFCPRNSDANEIQMCIVTLVKVAVLVRRKVNASVAKFQEFLGLLQGLIGKLVYFDGRETHVVESSLNVVNDPRARSRLIGQVRQDERFVVSHLPPNSSHRSKASQ